MTNPENAGNLTEKEGEDLFYKAFSEIKGQEYKPSEFRDENPPVVEESKEQPQAVEEPKVPEETAQPETTPEAAAKAPVQNQQPATIEQFVEQFPEDKRDLVKALIAERSRAEQQFRSTQGRLAAERKQRQQMEQELAKLRIRGASSPQDPALAEQAKVDHAKAIDEWKQVVEAEPTLAKAIDALTDAKVRSVQEEVAKARAEQEAAQQVWQQQSFEEEKNREMNLLLEAVPNALDVVASQEFQYWKENIAPPGLKQLADESINHMDALIVLQHYAPWAQHVYEQRFGKPASPTQAPAQSTVADSISKNREAQVSPVVQGTRVAPNASPAIGHEFGDDVAQQLFEEAYKKIKSR